MPPKKTCPAWLEPLLATVSQPQLAREAGVSVPTVARWQRERGIQPLSHRDGGKRPMAVPPELEPLLGTARAVDLAALAGVSVATITKWRRQRGIMAPKHAGQVLPDPVRQQRNAAIAAEVAAGADTLETIGQRHGLTREAVRLIATAAGVPPRAPARRAKAEVKRIGRERKKAASLLGAAARKIAEVETLLGSVSDYEVARRCGVSHDSVHMYRVAHGIAGVGPSSATHRRPAGKGRGEAAYRMRVLTGRSWSDIARRLRLANACSAARGWAQRTGATWPPVIDLPDEER